MIRQEFVDLCLMREGFNYQLDQTVEECAELIVAIAHRRRGRPDNLTEEVADVIVCVHILRLAMDTQAIDMAVLAKVARTERKLGFIREIKSEIPENAENH